jgi:molybdopterin molybdotransferase
MTPAPEPIPLDAALAIVDDAVPGPLPAETVPLAEAHQRYLAADLHAELDLPPFANAAMDGFALRAGDTPGLLRVVGESAAGHPFAGVVRAGEAVGISTGAAFPLGADTVVPRERVLDRGSGRIEVDTAIPPVANVRARGSDVRAGALILPAGSRLGPAQLGAAASTGRAELLCPRRPRVAIVATGSELRPPGVPLGPGQIYESNVTMLSAATRSAGARLVESATAVAVDEPADHRAVLTDALACADVVITSGGVSVGEHDLVRGVGAALGVQERFWRVALRPGKPVYFGVRDATLVFGLPGNPVSALVCFELFVRPALARMLGAPVSGPEFFTGRLSAVVRPNRERDELIRVRELPDGSLEPLSGQDSHQLSALAGADGLARIRRGTLALPVGAEVAYLPLHS